jgi:hypothetical protein
MPLKLKRKEMMMKLYDKLQQALRDKVKEHNLGEEKVSISCRDLSAVEAIGHPDDDDYPIIKGRERMMEAVFAGARGQAFSDEFGSRDYRIGDLLELPLDSNRNRADFIAAFNAIFRRFELCDHTIHCRDKEPPQCAAEALKMIGSGRRVLLVGLQPRFLEWISRENEVRVVDLDAENIGTEKFGVIIEPAGNTSEAIKWCDLIFATGSTFVNGTVGDFIDKGRPLFLYGVSAAAPARVLGLDTFCFCGH